MVPLFQKGTFIDGMLYKTVAFNKATTLNSFWQMSYTNTSMTNFCEQPPLYMYLLGVFYNFFGTYYLVDRFFTLLILIALYIFQGLIFKALNINVKTLKIFGIFLYATIPVFCWSVSNQVIEPLLCLFSVIQIFVFILFTKTLKYKYVAMFAFILLLEFLTKGFQSCFTIVFPITYYIFNKNKKGFLKFTISTSVIFILPLVYFLFMYKPAMQWYNCYFQSRLIQTFNDVGKTTNNNFDIIYSFITEPLIAICLVLLLVFYVKTSKHNFNINKHAFSSPLLITALAGSFPFALSKVQRNFYLLPAFVFLINFLLINYKEDIFLAFALLKQKYFKPLTSLAIIISVALAIYLVISSKSYKRDELLIKDVIQISNEINKDDTLGIPENLWNYFNLHSYLFIEKHISLAVGFKAYYLIDKTKNVAPNGDYVLVKDLNEFKLYKKIIN